jgi:hypothetical protein
MAECNCVNEQRLCAVESDLKRNSDQHKEFYNEIHRIDTAQAVSNRDYANILSTLAAIQSDLQAIKEKPAKRWDTIISSVITAIVAFVMGYLLR